MTDKSRRQTNASHQHDTHRGMMGFAEAMSTADDLAEQQGRHPTTRRHMPYVLGLVLVNMPASVRTTLIVSVGLGVIGGLFSQIALWLSSGTLGLIGMGAIVAGFVAAVVVSCMAAVVPPPRWSGTGKALLVPLALVAAGVALAVGGLTGITLATFVLAPCAFVASLYAVPATVAAGVGGERA